VRRARGLPIGVSGDIVPVFRSRERNIYTGGRPGSHPEPACLSSWDEEDVLNYSWMAFYPSDYRIDTLDLTTEQHGAYLMLLMLSWLRHDGIPNDMAYLKKALRGFCSDMHGNRFNRLIPTLLHRFFVLDADGHWRQPRLEIERKKSRKISEYAKEKSRKRWSGLNGFNGLGDAVAMHARARHTKISKKEEEATGESRGFEASPELKRLMIRKDH
jgi:uncharacterized protein YdaU (DUF1376 family)